MVTSTSIENKPESTSKLPPSYIFLSCTGIEEKTKDSYIWSLTKSGKSQTGPAAESNHLVCNLVGDKVVIEILTTRHDAVACPMLGGMMAFILKLGVSEVHVTSFSSSQTSCTSNLQHGALAFFLVFVAHVPSLVAQAATCSNRPALVL